MNIRNLLFILLLSLVIIACGDAKKAGEASSSEKFAAAKKSSVDGKKVYEQYCMTCHDAQGMPILTGAGNLSESTKSKDEVKAQIKYGSENKLMMAFEAILTSEQIDAVADHVLTLRKK